MLLAVLLWKTTNLSNKHQGDANIVFFVAVS